MTPELRLLLACARIAPREEDCALIHQLLDGGIDWTPFVRKALDHGLAGLACNTLSRDAADTVPSEILDALHVNVERTRAKNKALFNELGTVIESLTKEGIEAIPFKGPALALEAYGDLGLRVFRDLDFLIRDNDMARTVATLQSIGYEHRGNLTPAQIEVTQRIQGQDFLYKETAGIGVEPHTRLTPMRMALGIDYAGLFARARRTVLNGHSLLLLAPEDDLLLLAIHGGKEMWWRINWACDVAAFIETHPSLDWAAIAERARAQGCLRMVVLAAALARRYFNAAIPDGIVAAERADRALEPMIRRIEETWLSEETGEPPSNSRISKDRLLLHDGVMRRASYTARTLFLPGPHHVAAIALPRQLSFAYVPVKIVFDTMLRPLMRASGIVRASLPQLWGAAARSALSFASCLASAEARQSVRRHKAAIENANRAVAANPKDVMAWRALGNALYGLKRHGEAIPCYDKAVALLPDHTDIWKERDAVVAAMKKTDAHYVDRLVTADPKDAKEWATRAGYYWCLKRYADAADASDHALELDPRLVQAIRIGIHARLHSCDWRKREEDEQTISAFTTAGLPVVGQLNYCCIGDSESEKLAVAKLCAKDFPAVSGPLWRGERYRHDKIRIAYISTDFRRHPVSVGLVGCFEQHDKSRFETIAVSIGPGDASPMRRRIEAAFGRFIDAQDMSDAEIAAQLRASEIDIAIDLNGYTGAMRTGILAHRPAPVQANYLGYPGTMGLPYIDYVIADRMVIPDEHRIHYSEKIVYLPNTYMPNDKARPIAEKTPARAEAGLPEKCFVFACMNNTYKIGPEVFDIWMRLMRNVERSVLWLRSPAPSAMYHLRREAAAQGVKPERLIFAPSVNEAADHLARLRLADLFLDTRPYNAHATACDALWAGLPVLTCPGNSFASRVAASVLYAAGMPELVTSSLAEYEALALSLARDLERLAAIRAKLIRNRDTEPLFDTARFTRNLEAAYTAMWRRAEAGEPPEGFAANDA